MRERGREKEGEKWEKERERDKKGDKCEIQLKPSYATCTTLGWSENSWQVLIRGVNRLFVLGD